MPLGQRPLDRRNADKLSIFTPKGHLHAGLRTTDGECPRNGAFKVSDPGGGGGSRVVPKTQGNVGLHWGRAPAAEKGSQVHASHAPPPSSLSIAFRDLGGVP